jgi:methylmalonyl-CoA mutase C-terminal domain/subunit
MTLFPEVVEELRARDITDVPLFAGGIIAPGDVPPLAAIGIERCFPPGTPLPDIVTWLSARLGGEAASTEGERADA